MITHSTPRTTPMPGHQARRRPGSRCPRRRAAELEERSVAIQEAFHALPSEELAARPMPFDVARPNRRPRASDRARPRARPGAASIASRDWRGSASAARSIRVGSTAMARHSYRARRVGSRAARVEPSGDSLTHGSRRSGRSDLLPRIRPSFYTARPRNSVGPRGPEIARPRTSRTECSTTIWLVRAVFDDGSRPPPASPFAVTPARATRAATR